MKTVIKIILVVIIQILRQSMEAQGFVNLDFESASVSGFSTGSVPVTNAFPGWTAYIGDVSQTTIIYDTRPLDVAAVTLQGTNSDSLIPIQANFTAWLFGASSFAPQQSAGLGQTGQIPANAESLIFWGFVGSTDVSFANHILSLVVISNTVNYNIYGANISAFAGQTGQLLFTTPPGFNDIIDNIQFSSSPVPEPSELAVLALGASIFGFRYGRKVLQRLHG